MRLGEKDAATEGHTRRVAMLAVQVGEALGLPRGRLRVLALGGLLHDMGKLSVPSAVLTKPGPLDDDEFAHIRKHPEAGERLLRELGGFAPACCGSCSTTTSGSTARATRAGWRATSSTLDTRILAVCDVYDALVSDRVYRAAWSHGARARAAARRDAVRPGLRRRARAPARAAVRRRTSPAPRRAAPLPRAAPGSAARSCQAQPPAPAGCGAVGSPSASPSCSRAR